MENIYDKTELNVEFKKYLYEKDYFNCNRLIKKILINHIIKLINENIKGPKIKYTHIQDLINFSEKYIQTDDKYIASKIKNYIYEETELEELERLLILCDTYKILI